MKAVTLDESAVLRDVVRWPSGTVVGMVRVEEDNRFFFDHPLDHVPGMLVVEALVRAAEWRAGGDRPVPLRLVAASLQLTRLCEKDRPIRVEVRPAASGAGGGEPAAVEIRQDGVPTCRGTLSMLPAAGVPAWSGVDGVEPAPAELVHKRDQGAVLIGPLDLAGHRCQLRRAHPAGPVHPDVLLLEACRQFTIAAIRLATGPPAEGLQLLLAGLEVDRPRIPPGGPVELSGRARPGRHRAFVVPVQIHAGGRPAGAVTVHVRAVPTDWYRQWRRRRTGR